jgi:hypothetical protein
MRRISSAQKVERDLSEALQRLKVGTPTNPDLVRKSRRGVLRINPTTVAKEAGHSRTLISHERCAYPDIRAEILRYAPQRKPAKNLAVQNAELREEVAGMRRALRMSREERISVLLRMKKIEDKANKAIATAERRTARTFKEANEVGGRRLHGVPDEFEVIELTPNRDVVSKPTLVGGGTGPQGSRSL